MSNDLKIESDHLFLCLFKIGLHIKTLLSKKKKDLKCKMN